MFFTIEPMVNLGRAETKTLADDWTAVTRDKSLSAQFEHSIGVTEDGVRDLHALARGQIPPDTRLERSPPPSRIIRFINSDNTVSPTAASCSR